MRKKNFLVETWEMRVLISWQSGVGGGEREQERQKEEESKEGEGS